MDDCDKDKRIAELEKRVAKLNFEATASITAVTIAMLALDLFLQALVPHFISAYAEMLAGEPLPGLTAFMVAPRIAIFLSYIAWPTMAVIIAVALLGRLQQFKGVIRTISMLFLFKIILTIIGLGLPFIKLFETLC